MAQAYPEFRARAPWWGADLQTLRNALVLRRASADVADAVGVERLELPLADGSGDRVVARLELAQDGAGGQRPLVLLVHGLAGDSASPYMLATARALRERGHAVLRLDLRGAGASRRLCRLQYHAGRTRDLHDALVALRALRPGVLDAGVVPIGFSLGGNLVLKFLAEYAGELPLRAGASVSAPIDLAAAAQRFLAPRNRVYHWHMLRALKREARAGAAELGEAEGRRLDGARSIYEFDDGFVAPRNGYSGADAYYADNSAERFLGEIRVPALLVHALDDPWIPGDAYRRQAWSANSSLVPLLADAGGHVGFHGSGSQRPWHDRCIVRFLASLC